MANLPPLVSVALFIAICLATGTQALDCYQCQYLEGESATEYCKDDHPPSSVRTCEVGDNPLEFVCVRMNGITKVEGEDKGVIYRNCMAKNDPYNNGKWEDGRFLVGGVWRDITDIEGYTCEKNRCNSYELGGGSGSSGDSRCSIFVLITLVALKMSF